MAQIKMQYGTGNRILTKKLLYENGNEYINITGGWSADGYVGDNSGQPYPLRQGVKNTDNLSMSTTTTAQYTMFGTQTIIPLSKFNKL